MKVEAKDGDDDDQCTQMTMIRPKSENSDDDFYHWGFLDDADDCAMMVTLTDVVVLL